jgi:predicted nucleic acid-binding protein
MSASQPLKGRRPERVFLDANIIRGQLTTDILMCMAANKVLDPRWSERVMQEARDHRPPNLTEEAINHRFDAMNGYFRHAMVTGFEHREAEMQTRDEKDRHVLAAAVHSGCATLVTENDRDFKVSSVQPDAMRVERLSDFLNRKLDQQRGRVVAALHTMLNRNRENPRTMPELIDTMAQQEALKGFARELNQRMPPEQRGTALSSPTAVALEGIAPAEGAPTQQPRDSDAHRSQPAKADLDRGPEL